MHMDLSKDKQLRKSTEAGVIGHWKPPKENYTHELCKITFFLTVQVSFYSRC